MLCGKYLDFLPWRRRRRENNEEQQAETMELHPEGELNGVTVNDNVRNGFKREKNSKCYITDGKEEEGRERGIHILYMLMGTEEFQRGDPVCINFLKYIYQGNVEGFDNYLNGFSKEEIKNFEIGGQSLLHILCFKGDEKALRLVLAHDVDPNSVNADGVSPLHLAVNEGWTEGVEILLSYGASANILPQSVKATSWPFQELPILTAARNGDFATASVLLDKNPNLRLTDSERNTVLHLACFAHCVDLVMRLLEDKLILNEILNSNNRGNTPLHCLMTGENLPEAEEEIQECVQMLLKKGANINAVNAGDKTPLYLAARGHLPSVVKFLLESGADPSIRSREGKTVLHAACRSSSHESLSLLLKCGGTSNLVLVEDHFGYAPFHIAVSSCSINCCEVLIRNGDHLTTIDSLGRSRCSLVLRNMPSAVQLLKKLFDANIKISNEDPDDPEFYIKMNFSVLLSKSSDDVEASLISDFNGSEMESLLKHPLVESFLYLKWHRIRAFYYMYVLLFLIFLFVHTFYIVKTYTMNTDWEKHPHVLRMVNIAHIVMVFVLVVPGTITIFANIRKYFRQWETYFKIIALSTAAFVVFARNFDIRNKEVERDVASVSIFFTWVEFMMLLGRFPSLGIYILMFTRVAKSIIKFLIAFSPLLIAFTLSFGIVLNNIEVFEHFPIGFVKTLMMMLGEIDYSDIYDKTKKESTATLVISQLFLVAFLFLIPVLMANLLIGLAVNDLPDLQYHGKVRRLVKEASYLESYERLLLVFKEWTCIPPVAINLFSGRGVISRELTIYPNRLKKYKLNSPRIPSEAIKEAIATGTKEKPDKDENYLKISFGEFYKEYSNDRERLEKAIETLYEALASVDNRRSTNMPHSPFKNKRKVRSFT